ncbi:hypothetical protein [Streptomyces phytohabitans]|uniref:hypothetical protein n=1 Tax=Streptomyces phytohabitans TaxID=1150371 RepID=UPI00345B89B0
MRRTGPEAPSPHPLVRAFPRRLAGDVRAVLAVLPEQRYEPSWPFPVDVAGEALAVPYRLHFDEPPADAVRALTATRQTVLHCLCSRHSDGFVRQRHLERIVRSDEPWVVPYVVRPVGEYVLNILVAVEHGLTGPRSRWPEQRAVYGEFLARNPEFLALTECRAVSYWSYHHRHKYPTFATYPGHRLLELLRAAVVDRTGRPWPRLTPPGGATPVRR